jgi:hypothetical protein
MKLRDTWRPISTAFLLIATSIIFVPQAVAATSSPSIDYEFNGTLTDSAGGSSLSVLGVCPVPFVDPSPAGGGQCNSTTSFGSDASGDYWRWTSDSPRGGGFTITTNSPLTKTYSIALKFVFESDPVRHYSKIIDYSGKISDVGFYFNDWQIEFFDDVNTNAGTTTYSAGTVMDLVITRSEVTNLFSVYTRGEGGLLEQPIQYLDSGDLAIPINSSSGGSLLGFFFDDDDTDDEGNAAGRVYNVQTWSGAALSAVEVEAVTRRTAIGTNAAPPPPPPPWLQAYGRTEGGVCKSGWSASWAAWAISATGGWVCNRTIFWNGSSWVQNPNVVWGVANPAETSAWDRN